MLKNKDTETEVKTKVEVPTWLKLALILFVVVQVLFTVHPDWDFEKSPDTGYCYEVRDSFMEGKAMVRVADRFCDDN